MPTVNIELNIPGERAYHIRIADDLLSDIAEMCIIDGIDVSGRDVLVISDSNVAPLYLPKVRASLSRAGAKVSDVTIDAGESSKSIEVATEIWQAMAMMSFGRDSLIVALGGGVVGDISGFVASTYMRGISYVQVPTTLLAMVDSSVGGKTAINLAQGKNMVGTFYQPECVCASTDALATLDEREWACGLGEIAKSAAVDSDDFFFWLIDNAERLRMRDQDRATEAIKRSVLFKANVVIEDKSETKGVRECLNYGHTLAHAIETLSGYGTFSHGQAVAEGMRFSAWLGRSVVGTSEEFMNAQASLLDSLGLGYLDWQADPDQIISAMKRDKKARHGNLRFVLLSDVAKWSVNAVSDDVVRTALESYQKMKREALAI